jgi:hypothetical protein
MQCGRGLEVEPQSTWLPVDYIFLYMLLCLRIGWLCSGMCCCRVKSAGRRLRSVGLGDARCHSGGCAEHPWPRGCALVVLLIMGDHRRPRVGSLCKIKRQRVVARDDTCDDNPSLPLCNYICVE